MRNAFIYVIIAVLALFSCAPQPSDIRMPEIARVEAVPANNGCTLVVTFEELFSREYEIGFYYGLSDAQMSKVTAEQDSPASFTSRLTALEYDTEYFYKAYVSNGYNEICSDIGRFRTLAAYASGTDLPHNDVVLPPVEVHTWMTLLIDLDINVTPFDDASAQAQWLGCGSITNTPGGYSEVYFRAEESTADEDRTARFIVSYDGCESVMTVTQKARNATIEFDDPSVGIVLVDAFDSDGDGKVSYAEASRLTIDDAAKIDFSGLDIRSFDELRYFTEF